MTKTVKGMLIFALAAFCASLTFPLVASALDNEAVFRAKGAKDILEKAKFLKEIKDLL